MKYYDNLDVTGEIYTGCKIVATKEYVDGLISGEGEGLNSKIEALDTKLSEHVADFEAHENDFTAFKGENEAKIAELVAKDEELTGKLDSVEKHVQSEENPHKTSLKQVLDEGSVAEFGDTGEQYLPNIKIQVADYNRAKNDYVFQVNPEILKVASGCAGIEFSDGEITATGVIYGVKETDTRKTNALTTISLVNDIVDAGIKTVTDDVEKVKNDLNDKINEVVSSKVKVKVLALGEELPTVGDSLTIYFKPAKLDGKNDMYEEYMWLESGQSGRYELIGNTEIALADYVTNEKFNAQTAEFTASIKDLQDNRATKTEVDDAKEYAFDQAKKYTDSIGCSITDALKGCVKELKTYTDDKVNDESKVVKKYTDDSISASEAKVTDAYTRYVENSITTATTSITNAYTSYVGGCIKPVVDELCATNKTVYELGCAHEVNASAISCLEKENVNQEGRINKLYEFLIEGCTISDIKRDVADLNTRVTANEASIATNTTGIGENTTNIASNTDRIAALEAKVEQFSPVEVLRENATNATEIVVDGKDYKVVQVYQIVNKTRKLVVADITIDEANNKTIIGFATALSGTFDICLVK